MGDAVSDLDVYQSGVLRLEVLLPVSISALIWLKHQRPLLEQHLSFYFRQRDESTPESLETAEGCFDRSVFCGIGHAWLWKGAQGDVPTAELFEEIQRFLDPQNPSIRCVGGTRFDCERVVGGEWAEFGSCLFFIPAVEYHERPGGCALACTLAWNGSHTGHSFVQGNGAGTLSEAVNSLTGILHQIAPVASTTTLTPCIHRFSKSHAPSEDQWQKILAQTAKELVSIKPAGDLSGGIETGKAVQEYLESGQQGLDELLLAMKMSTEVEEDEERRERLSKLVLARRTELELEGDLNPHSMLQHLQNQDAHSYQFCLGVPNGGTFLGSTPERLYARNGNHVVSEAIAATRRRGPKGNLQEDFLIGLEMLQNPKDHVEFTLVRDWLSEALHTICSRVHVDVQKSILRRAHVQHLYGRLQGDLEEFQSEYNILKALHPTPAVCGRPQHSAKQALSNVEPFDRGYYAAPLGWFSGQGSEFVVAIRSGLVKEKKQGKFSMFSYAGVGTVKESNPESEWNELELKIRPFMRLFSPVPSPFSAPNANLRAAAMMVEELCRSGIHTFAVAPGSRSSPLVYAAATNPNCRMFPCIDERSLGFWSVGYGRATGLPAAVITSSGTAVGNLMPAVIEASLTRIPLILLTADRPSDLRRCGSNQTIDQVKIFGNYTRYFHDVPPPTDVDSAQQQRAALTMVDAAVRHACMNPAGPVHLNFQFNEPLAPIKSSQSLEPQQDKVLNNWWTSNRRFTQAMTTVHKNSYQRELMHEVWQTERGLLVVGELLTSVDQSAVAKIASLLKWPCVVDVLSGLKKSLSPSDSSLICTADQILTENAVVWESLQPDMILQIGGHLTSKRLMQYLQHCRLVSPEVKWMQVSIDAWRDDPQHLITDHITLSPAELYSHLSQHPKSEAAKDCVFRQLWEATEQSVHRSLTCSLSLLEYRNDLTEPYVSFLLSKMIPEGHGLFLGNGMPIRDMNMFGGLGTGKNVSQETSLISHVAANRGANGIDGVISTSIGTSLPLKHWQSRGCVGYAVGLRRPVTLLIGDISFLHDSNGMNFLRSETWPPMTLVIVNNSGGGIFDFLPIAETVPSEMYDSLWSTPQFISIAQMCQAYGVAHNRVTEPGELREALSAAWKSNQHCVVEAVTNRYA